MIRQRYEFEILREVLSQDNRSNPCDIIVNDTTDYPLASDEGDIFKKGADICATVAGNPKFAAGEFIPIYFPLMFGLLGHRLLVIRSKDAEQFAGIRHVAELSKLSAGVPNTWADADLLRANQFKVNETGCINSIFQTLADGECDYIAFGANEISSIFQPHKKYHHCLQIERSLRLYYPMAVVFYVASDNFQLAETISRNLKQLSESGRLMAIFFEHFKGQLANDLFQRKTISIENYDLPKELVEPMKQCRKVLEHSVSKNINESD